jgi:small subunit ribosomal protein S15
MLANEQKQAAVTNLAKHKTDTGSSAVQASIFTKRIEYLTDHIKANKHDYMARRGLLQLVGKRRRLLQYVAKKDSKEYLQIIKTLGIRR